MAGTRTQWSSPTSELFWFGHKIVSFQNTKITFKSNKCFYYSKKDAQNRWELALDLCCKTSVSNEFYDCRSWFQNTWNACSTCNAFPSEIIECGNEIAFQGHPSIFAFNSQMVAQLSLSDNLGVVCDHLIAWQFLFVASMLIVGFTLNCRSFPKKINAE